MQGSDESERVLFVQQYTSVNCIAGWTRSGAPARPGVRGRLAPGGRIAQVTAVMATLFWGSGCNSQFIQDTFVGQTPHERYEVSLRAANLAETALGKDWLAAADQSLQVALGITTPFEEVGYLDPAEARAVGYRVNMRRGQHISAKIEVEDSRSVLVFLDLFVLGTNAVPRLLTSADSGSHEIEYTARRDGQYLLRIQPELLRGGRYSFEASVTGSLAFPVGGHDIDAILSVFGDPRDGGRRRHHGVDIFAARGTPVVAVASGVINRVGSTRLGGKIIWQRDSLGQSFYYAHLDRQVVTTGASVARGDTIGFVGNSGNARTTPPHLHFGVYQRGPKDPFPYLEQLPTNPRTFIGELAQLGQWARARRAGTRVRESPTIRARVKTEVPLHTPMRVLAGTGSWYRVYLPDGTTGFVSAAVTEAANDAIQTLAGGAMVLSGPTLAAAPVDSVEPGEHVPVLGMFGEFALVQSSKGRAGWVHLLD